MALSELFGGSDYVNQKSTTADTGYFEIWRLSWQCNFFCLFGMVSVGE